MGMLVLALVLMLEAGASSPATEDPARAPGLTQGGLEKGPLWRKARISTLTGISRTSKLQAVSRCWNASRIGLFQPTLGTFRAPPCPSLKRTLDPSSPKDRRDSPEAGHARSLSHRSAPLPDRGFDRTDRLRRDRSPSRGSSAARCDLCERRARLPMAGESRLQHPVRPTLSADLCALAVLAAAERLRAGLRRRRSDRDSEQVPHSLERQAHLQPDQRRAGCTDVADRQRLGLTRSVGIPRSGCVVSRWGWIAVRLSIRAKRRDLCILDRVLRRGLRSRTVAWRPADDPLASAAEALPADLRVLHDLRPEDDAELASGKDPFRAARRRSRWLSEVSDVPTRRDHLVAGLLRAARPTDRSPDAGRLYQWRPQQIEPPRAPDHRIRRHGHAVFPSVIPPLSTSRGDTR